MSSDESVYNLIPEPEHVPPKPPLWRSKVSQLTDPSPYVCGTREGWETD